VYRTLSRGGSTDDGHRRRPRGGAGEQFLHVPWQTLAKPAAVHYHRKPDGSCASAHWCTALREHERAAVDRDYSARDRDDAAGDRAELIDAVRDLVKLARRRDQER